MNRVFPALLLLSLATVPAGAETLPVSRAASSDQQLATQGVKVARAHAHYLLARQLEAEGRMREALHHYLSYLQNGSHDPDLLAHITSLAENYEGLESALEVLDQVINEQPGNVQPVLVYIQMALTFAADNEAMRSRATELAQQALNRFPLNNEVYEVVIRLHLALGEREQAEKILRDAALQPKDDAPFWLALGRCAQEVWPLADQEQREAHLIKINPFFANASKSALETADESSALQVIDYYLFSNQMTQAIETCEALVKQSGSLEARKRQVRLYDAVERRAEAFEALEALVQAYPEDIEHQRLLAAHYRNQRDWDKAIKHLETAMQAGGGSLQDYLMMSNLLLLGKDVEKLDRFTSRGEQLFPEEPTMGFMRACALSELQRYAEATSLFQRVAQTAETSTPELLDDSFYFNWGAALERHGKYDEAARQFDKSIQLTPPDRLERAANTMNYLGYMWLEQNKNLDKAEQLIVKANELIRNNPAYIDSLGWLYFKKGRHSDALRELLRAEELMEELEPGDAEILEHIAQTYERLDNKDKAREYWQRTLDLEPPQEDIRSRARQALGLDPPAKPKDEREQPKLP